MVTHCLTSKLNRESQWTRKNSITKLAQETMDTLPVTHLQGPYAKAKALVKSSTTSIKDNFQKKWTDHLKHVVMQLCMSP